MTDTQCLRWRVWFALLRETRSMDSIAHALVGVPRDVVEQTVTSMAAAGKIVAKGEVWALA